MTWPSGTQAVADATVSRQRPASGRLGPGQTAKGNQSAQARPQAPAPAPAPAPAQGTTGSGQPSSAAKPARNRPRRTRRARLRVSRIDPWSVMKTSLLFGVAGFLMFVVSTYLVMTVIDATGLWDAVNALYKDLLAAPNDPNEFEIRAYVSTGKVTGLSAVLGAVNVVIFTALATVFSFLYNLSATMLGGLEITLAED
ncbi:MAG: DUF3566 domain-containing protein [Actinomycetia bacterium]|nr:DUF3566 domain-containing protein [Actinomycetes bacterium]